MYLEEGLPTYGLPTCSVPTYRLEYRKIFLLFYMGSENGILH
jgi:hypothetical protein